MNVTVIPIVIGALGTVKKELVQRLEDMKIRGGLKTIQTIALLRSVRILRRVLETWEDCVKNSQMNRIIIIKIMIIIIIIIIEIFTPVLPVGISLESEWQQVSLSLQDSSQYSGWSQQNCCLDVLISSIFLPSFLETVSRAPVIIIITVTLMFHNFFIFLARFSYLSLFWLYLLFLFVSPEWQNPRDFGLLAGIRWSVCISKSQRILCFSFSRTDIGLCMYHLEVWSYLYL